jgi:hypothetical protein
MSAMVIATFLGPVGRAYRDQVIDSGREVEFFLILSFLLSFLAIRASTRLMRSPKVPWWPGSVTPGGMHIHHLVFGIVMMMLSGFFAFAEQPGSPWIEILAVIFGTGAGLTIDEFALWLYLEDVYWTKEGRSSVDAFIVAALVACLGFLGLSPLQGDLNAGDLLATAISLALSLALFTVTLSKGKPLVAVIGLFLPFVQMWAAIRLARPGSWWARRRYTTRPKKLEKATARDAKWSARRLRIRDALGGAPSLERTTGE